LFHDIAHRGGGDEDVDDAGEKKKNPLILALERVRSFVKSDFVKKASCFYLALTCTEQFNLKFMMNKGDKVMKSVFPRYEDGKKALNASRYIADEFSYELKQLSIPASIVLVNMLDVASLDSNVLRPLLKPVIEAAKVYAQKDQERIHAEVAAALMSSAHKKSSIVVPASTVKSKFEIKSGFVSLLGPRKQNEDSEVCCDDFKLPDLKFTNKIAVYAVYDGHGGKDISAGCKKIVARILISQPTFPMDPITAFKTAFAEADQELTRIRQKSGSTAVLATILGNTLLVGNIGDSECVLASLIDGQVRYELLSHKHSVNDPDERQRIEKIERGVILCGRIQGSLAVARSFGDFDYKTDGKLFVSVEPHIAAHPLHPNDQFLILGCDGLWDTVTYRDAVITAHKLRGQGKQPEEVAKTLGQLALERGSTDNVTVIVVYFIWEKKGSSSSVSATPASPVSMFDGPFSESHDSDECTESCPTTSQVDDSSETVDKSSSSIPQHHKHQHRKHHHHQSHAVSSTEHKSHSHHHGNKDTTDRSRTDESPRTKGKTKSTDKQNPPA